MARAPRTDASTTEPAEPAHPSLRNSIVKFDPAVDPHTLNPNEANPRRHPEQQQRALGVGVDTVGFINGAIVNLRTGRMIDGHDRRRLAIERGSTMPVLYVDLDEAEEAFALATFDPIGAMANFDEAAMTALKNRSLEAGFDSATLDAVEREARGRLETTPAGSPVPPGEFPEYDESIPTEHTCPKCGYRWSGGSSSGPAATAFPGDE